MGLAQGGPIQMMLWKKSVGASWVDCSRVMVLNSNVSVCKNRHSLRSGVFLKAQSDSYCLFSSTMDKSCC